MRCGLIRSNRTTTMRTDLWRVLISVVGSISSSWCVHPRLASRMTMWYHHRDAVQHISVLFRRRLLQHNTHTRQSQTADSAPGVATREVTWSTRKVVPHILQPSPRLHVRCASAGRRRSWAATSSNLGLWANMTSSIKAEVHNVSQRRQRRTERRP